MIKYSVNENKGVVVAYFEGGIEYWVTSIMKKLDKLVGSCDVLCSDVCFDEIASIVEKVLVNRTVFVGMARTNFSDGDTFNLEKGKLLAHNRLLDKYTRAENEAVKLLATMLTNRLKTITDRVK